MLTTTPMLCMIRKDERTRIPTLAETAGLYLAYTQGRQWTSHRPARRPHQPVADARWRKGVGAWPRCEDQERLGVGLMLAYPIVLDDDDGTVLVTSPDFPELTTYGDDPDEAVARAVDALEEAIAARIHDRKDVPAPSEGQTCAVLPTLTSVKVILYQGMRDQGVGKAGVGPSIRVVPASGGPGAGRTTPVRAGHDGRGPGSHRAAVARDRRDHVGNIGTLTIRLRIPDSLAGT